MKTIIAGSRNLGETTESISNIIDTIIKKTDYKILTILSGASGQVDNLAIDYAIKNNIEWYQYPADWNSFNRAAGPIRNLQMVNNADMLILIWDGQSKGSLDVKTKAEKKGLIIQEVRIENGINQRTVIWNLQKKESDTTESIETS